MLRPLLAVAAGFVTWTVLFLSAAAAVRSAFPDAHGAAGEVFDTVPLIIYLVLAIVASLAAGAVAQRAAPTSPLAVQATAALLFAVGLAVQIGSWALAPSWYNVAFLLVLIPATLAGARIAPARVENGSP